MKLLSLFPLPDFLKLSAHGFDISDESIKYIKFKDGVIENYGEKKLPAGIIENGEIRKEKEFTDFLKSGFENSGIKNIIASLPEEKAFLDIIEIPRVRENEIRNIIRMQFENYFPLKVKDSIFDYEILNSTSDFYDILIAVFPKEIIESYKISLIKAGFIPFAFDLEVEALKRALFQKDSNIFRMLVDFGKTRTTFIIIKKDKVLFTTTVNIGGEDLDRILSKSLSLTLDEAEIIKKEKGRIFPYIKESAADMNKENEIQSVLMPVISEIEKEIKKYIEYFKTHYSHIHKKTNGDNVNIEEIILCGGDANFIGLADYLSKAVKTPVRLANVWENAINLNNMIPEIEFNESLKYATAIGLALKPKEMNWE